MVILIAHQLLVKFDSHLDIFALMELEPFELQMNSTLYDEGGKWKVCRHVCM